MHLSTRKVGDVSVIDISGGNPGETTTVSICDTVAHLHSHGEHRIVLHLAELNYIDSSGLGDLVSCNVRAAQSGRPIKVAALTRRMHDLLRMTRLTAAFDSYETLEAALTSFNAPPQRSTGQP